MPWDAEGAAAAGRKGAEVRRRRATMTPEERALDSIGRRLGELTTELLAAALGEGDFEELKLDTRVAAIKTLMEWRLGKPGAVKPTQGDPEDEAGASITADSLFSE